MSFGDVLEADQRLVILRLLARAPEYTANSSVIHAGLRTIGHEISRDLVATHLAWLNEQHLIGMRTLPTDTKDILIARLTERGLDVQAGRAEVPGVARPSPV